MNLLVMRRTFYISQKSIWIHLIHKSKVSQRQKFKIQKLSFLKTKKFLWVKSRKQNWIFQKSAFLSDQNDGFPLDDENNPDCKYSHAPVDMFVDLSKRTTDVMKLIGVGDDAETANDFIETKIMRLVTHNTKWVITIWYSPYHMFYIIWITIAYNNAFQSMSVINRNLSRNA